jgi:hypothetical protein
MDRDMLVRHLEQAERHLAESEAHVQLCLEHLQHAHQKGWAADRQRRALELAVSLRIQHAQRVAYLREELGVAPIVEREAESEVAKNTPPQADGADPKQHSR